MLLWLKEKWERLVSESERTLHPETRPPLPPTIIPRKWRTTEGRPRPATAPTIEAMRANLVQAELYEETQSVRRRTVHIVPAGSHNPVSRERRSFTEEGLLTREDQYLLQTCDGRLATDADMRGGGLCSVHLQYTDRKGLTFCSLCHRPICFRCARLWEGEVVCPDHYQFLRHHYDTWQEDQRRR